VTPNTVVTANPDGTFTTLTNGVERHTFRTLAAAEGYAERRAVVGYR